VHDRLTVGAAYAVCVVEEQPVDHSLVFHSKLRSHDVLLHLLAELLKSPAGVELDFKFDLLGARILGIGDGVLVGRVHLLKVLILDFNRHEQLDALVVLHLVPRHERGLLARLIEGLYGGRSRLWLRLSVVRLLHRRRVLLILFEVDALGGAGLICNLALLVDVG